MCSGCGNDFTWELFLQQDSQLCCLFCNSQVNALAEIREMKNEVAGLRDELHKVKKLVQDGKAVKVANVNQEESRVEDSVGRDDGFQTVRNGRKANVQTIDSASTTLQNRFGSLQKETEPELDVILVVGSLVIGQGYEFVEASLVENIGCKVEDITERVDHLLENSKEKL
ncbi:hypothetical protein E2C01_088723 [Portunus trituberculatus]|uniref:Uncharacterized protein n=1 Tax=Portunus trituberculatus TaxID=210409 RepID=A0A5B7JFF7_PORTR|nr:hypothetical protein [Portunus trituberculatus]